MALRILHEPEAQVGGDAANELLDDGQRRLLLQNYLVSNYDSLKRKLVRHLGSGDAAGECLHDAWIRLSYVEIPPVKSPEAYVYRMACNVAVDRIRSGRSWQYTGDADTALEEFADQGPGPEEIAEVRSELQAVDRALERLPRRHRAVLMALRVDEMSREDVSQRYALSMRSVDTALRQALDYCALSVNQQVLAGVSSPRRTVRFRRISLERATRV